jgi:UDP-N-acetylmuramoyl-tripeptide--D-alanyl-D-alanine ligase
MHSLWEALPKSRQGGYAATAEELAQVLADAVQGGDVVLIKGSAGSRMAKAADALAALGAPAAGAR